MRPKLGAEAWVKWLVTGITLTAAVITYAYANFETKEHAKERYETVQEQMRDANAKLDILIGFTPGRVPATKKTH